jgi:two-component system sensor histidine kinase YesM
VTLISILSFTLLQVSFKVYDNQLINGSSQLLNLYSTNVENELRKIEALTFDIAASNESQNNLKIINRNISSYERYVAIQSMIEILTKGAQAEDYISSISFVDLNENMYTVGNSTISINKKKQGEIVKLADKKSGQIVWIEPQGEDTAFIGARQIRSLSNLNVIGTLIVRINAETLVNFVSSMSPQYKANLIILSDNKDIIYRDKKLISDSAVNLAAGNVSNKIYNIDKEKFLLNRQVSGYSNWSYVYFLSYENIFKNIVLMRTIMAFSFLVILVIAIFLGLSFANSITRPIITLSKKMKKIENGDFESIDLRSNLVENCDEVGQLNNNFIIMINKINDLIKENYVKQILIKETELRTLQLQINPHFLYNTLDSINWLAKATKQNKIALMVKSLANLLRSCITNKDNIITVKEELKLLNNFITIQKIRFEERLEVNIFIEEDLKDFYIPKLTLQPIVENSIKYGLEQFTGVCRVDIRAERYEDFFEILVIDNGPGVSDECVEKVKSGESKPQGTGIGLKNIDDRIKLFFGSEFGVSMRSSINEGTTVIVRIPYK